MVGRTNVRRKIDRPLARAVMGFEWDFSNPSPVLVRLGHAAGLTATAGIGADAGHSDFDRMPIYKDIRRCNLREDGTVTAYEGESEFTFTPPVGIDVMVEIPLFYYRIEHNDLAQTRREWVSNYPADGFLPHPAFARPTGTVDKIYMAAYESTNNNRSISGAAISWTGRSRTEHRTWVRAKGSGWNLDDVATVFARNMLILVEFANLNVQAAIGPGRVRGNEFLSTGRTNDVVGSGREAGIEPDTVSVVWRGIENPWGNITTWVDGINISNNQIWFCQNPAHYADDTTTNYTQLSYTTPAEVTIGNPHFMTRLGFDPAVPWLGLPQGPGGSSTTFLTDACRFWPSGWRGALVGGQIHTLDEAGLFSWHLSILASVEGQTVNSTRLLYIPPIA